MRVRAEQLIRETELSKHNCYVLIFSYFVPCLCDKSKLINKSFPHATK